MDNKNIKELFEGFTPKRKDKERMFNNILVKRECNKSEKNSLPIVRRLRPSILTAAMLIFIFTTATFATIYLELDTKFLNFLNPSSNEQAEYLANGAYTVGKKIIKKNGTLEIKQVIGDDNTTLILMDFIAAKGTVLNSKYYSFDDVDIDAGQNFYSSEIISLEDGNSTDNKISMIMRINTKESLIGEKAHVKFTDLKKSDTIPGEFTTSVSGEWEASFNLDFENYSTNYHIDKDITIHDYKANLKTISVSPISVTLKLESSFTKEISKAIGGWNELGLNEYSDVYPVTINYKDGTSEITTIFNGMHNIEHLKGEMIFIKNFESVINDKEIKSITFFNNEFEINN